jgi:hypothetical protein
MISVFVQNFSVSREMKIIFREMFSVSQMTFPVSRDTVFISP